MDYTKTTLGQHQPNQIDLTTTPQTLHNILRAHFAVNWAQQLSDTLLDNFVNHGFVILDDVYRPPALLALQVESGLNGDTDSGINSDIEHGPKDSIKSGIIDDIENGINSAIENKYRDALITNGIRQSDIRGDRIRWITPNYSAGSHYLDSIDELAQLLNRTLYAGIRRSEAHYACYPAGFGYQWHQDNPSGRSERVVSAVFYLNNNWTIQDGGALSIIDLNKKPHKIMPKANRLILFNSQLRHQVEIAHRQRYSIATWMRRDDAISPVV